MKGRQAREHRHEKALILTKERAKRSPQQQLDLLDERLGEGLGAKKERANLEALIQKETKQKTKQKPKKKADR